MEKNSIILNTCWLKLMIFPLDQFNLNQSVLWFYLLHYDDDYIVDDEDNSYLIIILSII
jgi:hypothetical protein